MINAISYTVNRLVESIRNCYCIRKSSRAFRIHPPKPIFRPCLSIPKCLLYTNVRLYKGPLIRRSAYTKVSSTKLNYPNCLFINFIFCQLLLSSTCAFFRFWIHQFLLSSTFAFINFCFHQLLLSSTFAFIIFFHSSTFAFINFFFHILAILSTFPFINLPFHELFPFFNLPFHQPKLTPSPLD